MASDAILFPLLGILPDRRSPASWSPDAKPEKIVRPFEAFRERRDQALERLRAVPGESFEAELCWGEASDLPGTTAAERGGGFKTKKPGDEPEVSDEPEPGEDKKPRPKQERDLEWNEDSRKVKKIRVENPDDPEQYVMVERIEVLYMRAPSEQPFNGKRHMFTFKNK